MATRRRSLKPVGCPRGQLDLEFRQDLMYARTLFYGFWTAFPDAGCDPVCLGRRRQLSNPLSQIGVARQIHTVVAALRSYHGARTWDYFILISGRVTQVWATTLGGVIQTLFTSGPLTVSSHSQSACQGSRLIHQAVRVALRVGYVVFR